MSDYPIMHIRWHGAVYCLDCGVAAGASAWGLTWQDNMTTPCAACGGRINALGDARRQPRPARREEAP